MKLSPSDYAEIRKRRAAGAKLIDLARAFGVSVGRICQLVRGAR